MDLRLLNIKNFHSADLVAVYCNTQATENFLVGNILALDAEYLVLSLLSPEMSEDGICLCATKAIYRIEQNSRYLLDLKKKAGPIRNLHLGGDPWNNFWEYVQENKLVAQVKGFPGKRILFGISVGHTDEAVAMRRVCLDCVHEKTTRVTRNRIALVVCNSDTERELQSSIQGRDDLNA